MNRVTELVEPVMLDEADRLAATATKVWIASNTASSTGAEAAKIGLKAKPTSTCCSA
ncbi:hypothetical protein [Arthrobacter sp. 24S4-2]|uniref:hypothetical protein n=1 Tax=Arthrobacter sp. 24S4-2 TaxID=2575374 RepID=UPI001C2FD6D3|nr:hypothetical protein [Arthrobacter sp. 24S4-2]